MAIRNLIYIDDERLRQRAKRIRHFTPDLAELAQDMLDTMQAYGGVGLAAPQIGVMQRIFVAKIPLRDAPADAEPVHSEAGKTFVLLNPHIVNAAPETVDGEEGCLSIPGWRGEVARPEWVEVKAQAVDGSPIKLKAEGYLARIFCHELDHLDGVLYLDHIQDETKLWKLDDTAQPADSAEPVTAEQ